MELTPPAGAAPGFPLLQAAIAPRRTTAPNVDRGLLQGIAAILNDFTVALILQWRCRGGRLADGINRRSRGWRTPAGRIRRLRPRNSAARRRWRHQFHRPLVTSTPCALQSKRAPARPP